MERDARKDTARVDQISCRIGCPETPSAPIGWPELSQMDAMDAGIDWHRQIESDVPVSAPQFPMLWASPRHPDKVYAESK